MFLLTVTMLVVAVLAYSCDDDDEVAPPVEKINRRSVLVFMVAENSLYSFVNGVSSYTGDLTEMLQGCKNIPDSCELVVYVDDLKNPRIYVIDNKTTARRANELKPELEYDDDGNSASPEVLNQTLKYMYTKHKAKSYGLVMWSHGSGWIEGMYDSGVRERNGKKTSFGIDNLKNLAIDEGPSMEISDMAKVLEQYDNLNFVLFDACFMQCIECLYTLRNSADYIIGSSAEIPGLGAPYDRIMASMFAEPFVAGDIARIYYDYYQNEDKEYNGVLLSVVDTKQLDNFAKATKEAIGDIDLRNGKYVGVMRYFPYDNWYQSVSFPDFYDMKGIMMSNLPADRYENWLKALDEITVAKYATKTWYSYYYHGYVVVDSTQYSGISMYVPLQKYIDHDDAFTSGYYKTDWYKALTN